jgi:tetratricopeptide (TPR) repeat protein
LVTWADYGLANSAREAVEKIYATHGKQPKALWFQGHWGFQYYMELRGGRPDEWRRSLHDEGDILIVPENNCYTFPTPLGKRVNPQETTELFLPCRWLSTMNRYGGAGFYSDRWGPLPFVIEPALPERYHVLQIETARHIDDSPKVIDKNKEESDKAIAHYTQNLSEFLYDPETFYNRGKAYSIGGEYEKAISDYTQALIIFPYYVEVYYNRGDAYFLRGEYGKAISDYTQVLRIDSRDFKAYLKRGNTYIMNEEYDKALFNFHQALRIHPNDPGAYHNRAVAYFKKGDYDKAWEDVKKAKRLGFNINPAFLEQLRKSSGRQQ